MFDLHQFLCVCVEKVYLQKKRKKKEKGLKKKKKMKEVRRVEVGDQAHQLKAIG